MMEERGGVLELEELITQVDIVAYISQYIDLEEKNGEFWGLSCFKDEKTPSFSVRQSPPVFYDYSSGIGGNLYTFIRAYERCSGREAVEKIKKFAGYDGTVVVATEKMSATETCRKFLKPKTRQKESRPTILPENHMERYEIDRDKMKIWADEGISYDAMDRFQVRYDGISDRLVYPIRDLAGSIVNIGGRTLDPEWKSKGLRKYTYFYGWGGTMSIIYGLFENMDAIKKHHTVILFEGCKSVLKAQSWGILNTGALLTSHLNPAQMKILARLGCDVIFALDKGVDIREDKNIARLKRYVNVSYLLDTDDMLADKDSPVDRGKDVFVELCKQRRRFR